MQPQSPPTKGTEGVSLPLAWVQPSDMLWLIESREERAGWFLASALRGLTRFCFSSCASTSNMKRTLQGSPQVLGGSQERLRDK